MGTILKESYEIPQIYVEEFTPNHAITTCNSVTGYVECLKGSTKDSASIFQDSNYCSNIVGYTANITKATAGTSNSSILSSSSTSWTFNTTTGIAQYNASGTTGIAYFCSDGNGNNLTYISGSPSHWSLNNDQDTIVHSSSYNCIHPQVAAVNIDTMSIHS